jgi:hypothetical protein
MSTPATYNHADPQMCRQCHGLCCQGHPGVWVEPQRFLQAFNLPRPHSPDALRAMLPAEVILRAIDGVAIPAPQSHATGCIFLLEDGCRLPESRRPGQCLALVPSLDTLIDGEIRCHLQPQGSTLNALGNWRRFWNQP